jgi:hypothetical protein
MKKHTSKLTKFVLIKHGSLHNKVAQRIFVLFILCGHFIKSIQSYLLDEESERKGNHLDSEHLYPNSVIRVQMKNRSKYTIASNKYNIEVRLSR